MAQRNKYLTIAGILVALLIVGGIGAVVWFRTQSTPEKTTNVTATGDVSQTVENPEITANTLTDSNPDAGENPTQQVDNSDVKDSISTPNNVQQVIDDNKDNVNNQEVLDQMAQSYPSDLIPLYKAKTAADSNDIITDNGKPGWTANYGSDASVDEISQFYERLIGSSDGFQKSQTGDSVNMSAVVDNCNVQISVTPNNPDRTGLDDKTSVDIFIERR